MKAPSLISKKIKGDFVIIDSQFPQKQPLGFRNTEINEYLVRISNAEVYTMHPMVPGAESWFVHGYGVEKDIFSKNLGGYLKYYPDNKKKIHYLEPKTSYDFKLAYSFFLAETYVLLPFYEKNKIPFVFVLYPGGGFGLNNSKSDAMLGKILSSKYFRGVIVTQGITQNYLLGKEFCAPEKIHLIYGGFVQFNKEEIPKKQYYPNHKKTFDLCFVAAKYSDRGVDKGYDLFVEVAKNLSLLREDIRFHVVGGFDEKDIPLGAAANKTTFYGYRQPDFLKELYSRMDIFLGPGRPFKLFEGNFDGFPLGIDAAYSGVALFVSDPLNMNSVYKSGSEIEIVQLNPDNITEKIMQYYHNPELLKSLSLKCQKRTQELFDTDFQIKERLKVFGQHVKLGYGGK